MIKRRASKKTLSLAISIIVLGVALAQQQGWLSPVHKQLEASQPGQYSIDHFVDGDTIAVRMNGTVESIRMIGIDTPETHKPNTPVQCYGPAAAAFTKRLIGNGQVRLEADKLSENRDRYNRLLRYVYLPDGTLVNEQLVRQGYGFYYPYFPYTKSAQFERDQKQAIAENLGLWAHCHPVATNGGGYKSNPESG